MDELRGSNGNGEQQGTELVAHDQRHCTCVLVDVADA